jgi:hypothetical protein
MASDDSKAPSGLRLAFMVLVTVLAIAAEAPNAVFSVLRAASAEPLR